MSTDDHEVRRCPGPAREAMLVTECNEIAADLIILKAREAIQRARAFNEQYPECPFANDDIAVFLAVLRAAEINEDGSTEDGQSD